MPASIPAEPAAIVWDFDGTLVDSRSKNLRVTRRIVERVTGRKAQSFGALRTLASYDAANRATANWRVLYRETLGLSRAETERAGALWSEMQLADSTPTPVYRGIGTLLRTLGRRPHAVVSQNSRAHIKRVLAAAGLAKYFRYVVGYEEVPAERQKPAPDGLLMCLEALGVVGEGVVVYVGDHETDMACVREANRVLKTARKSLRVIDVAALWGGYSGAQAWRIRPTRQARRVADLVKIVAELQPVNRDLVE